MGASERLLNVTKKLVSVDKILHNKIVGHSGGETTKQIYSLPYSRDACIRDKLFTDLRTQNNYLMFLYT